MIVVDASLAAKWFLNEPDSDAARTFYNRNRAQLCGPDQLVVEVSRALVAAANARRMSDRAARAAIAIWLEATTSEALALYPNGRHLIQSAVNLALDLGHPLADCLYLALAVELDCDLATCDVKFRNRAVARHPRVRLLADFS